LVVLGALTVLPRVGGGIGATTASRRWFAAAFRGSTEIS